ncbi:hypothetical protein niasHS_000402 [Heterodera schachtii]|uniref:Amino acid transporter transmembrane domain-containing protein n=1 Tax=Heterodera schachtii TaxID=97005 RepID=A0ABD2KCA8_HETSC
MVFGDPWGWHLLSRDGLFRRIWTLQGGVPLTLALFLFPFLNFKSLTFFMNFKGMGIISICYLMCFTILKAIECKFNFDFFDPTSEHCETFQLEIARPQRHFGTRIFFHNAILTILRNQNNPVNNSRDLLVGYALSAFCYILIGSLFFLAFPTFRDCIADHWRHAQCRRSCLSALPNAYRPSSAHVPHPCPVHAILAAFTSFSFFYVVLIDLAILSVALSLMFYPHVGAMQGRLRIR